MGTMINTIIFDLSDVLIKGLAGSENYLRRYSREIEVTHLYIKPLADFFVQKTSEDEYWKAVTKRYGWNIPITVLKKAVRDNFTEIDGTRDIIKTLQKKGYKLGLLSVHAKEWVDYCEQKYNYHNLFNAVSYSYESLICKPDKKAFAIILRRLKSKADQCLFIDDNIINTNAAEQMGIKSILFKSPAQLRRDLLSLGIL